MEFHILDSTIAGDAANDEVSHANCAFHYPVPGGVNSAGEAWQEIIAETEKDSETGLVESAVPAAMQTSGELDAMRAGSVIEVEHSVQFTGGTSTPQSARLQAIKDAYTAGLAEVQARITSKYKFFGYAADVEA